MNRSWLNPLILSLLLFGGQALLWLIAMPDVPRIPNGAPKFWDATAFSRYFIFLVVWVIGAVVGWGIASTLLKGTRQKSNNARAAEPQTAEVRQPNLKGLTNLGFMSLALAGISELVYLREILGDPQLILDSLLHGGLAQLAGHVRDNRIVGITTLTNLSLLSTTIFAVASFTSLQLSPKARKAAGIGLAISLLLVIMHGFLSSERAHIIYALIVIGGARLLPISARPKGTAKSILVVGLIAIITIWSAETLRSGQNYANASGQPLLSKEVQGRVLDVLVGGYLAADFNNMLTAMSQPPVWQLGTGTSFQNALGRLGLHHSSYTELSSWSSGYGTLHVFAIWWFDTGYSGLVIALLVSLLLSVTYRLAVLNNSPKIQVLFLLCLPGIFASLRINYFFLNVFLVPALVLLFYFITTEAVKNSK